MSVASRTLVIINHTAAAARLRWPVIQNALEQNKILFDLRATTRAGDAETITRAAIKTDYRTICVIGGDGTLSEAASGFFERAARDAGGDNDDADFSFAPVNPDAALAILPVGTGDDFARGLTGGTREPVEKWIEKLIAHCRDGDARVKKATTRAIDVIAGKLHSGKNNIENDAHSFICLNVATLGIGAQVAGRVAGQNNSMRRLSGDVRFTLAALGALAVWRERKVRVTLDENRVIECDSNLLALANGIYAGGGMMFAPDARLDDGELNFLIGCNLTRAAILRELPRIRRGTHLKNPNVRTAKATRVHIETRSPEDALLIEADGNLRGHTPAEFRVLPASLRIVC
ncbi:MAG: diacylglycerol kinase family protein [Pyrinomonadaceae bacterium]